MGPRDFFFVSYGLPSEATMERKIESLSHFDWTTAPAVYLPAKQNQSIIFLLAIVTFDGLQKPLILFNDAPNE